MARLACDPIEATNGQMRVIQSPAHNIYIAINGWFNPCYFSEYREACQSALAWYQRAVGTYERECAGKDHARKAVNILQKALEEESC